MHPLRYKKYKFIKNLKKISLFENEKFLDSF